MSEGRWHNPWLTFGLAFVGGYGDAASFILAKTFTGHLTGNFVLAAISIASQDWPTFFRRTLAIAVFLTGILLSVILERFVTKRTSWSPLPLVMGLEIVLISTAYVAMISQLTLRLELFVICMVLALGLQNGALGQAKGISVHTTFITGIITNLLTSGAARQNSQEAQKSESAPKTGLLCGIWFAFVLGAAVGALLVFRFEALGILGMALALFALMIYQSVTRL
jgi:uncharacterized membrane protein YoaK (UPF0700 family)